MVSNQITVMTTATEYELNFQNLDRHLKLVQVILPDYKFRSTFQKQLRQMDYQAITSVRRLTYLILLKQNAEWPDFSGAQATQVRFSNMEKYRIYPNHVMQLFLNQQTSQASFGSIANHTNGLFISLPDMKQRTRSGLKQRFAINIRINWTNDLELSVSTFTEAKQIDNAGLLYYWNQKLNRMELCQSIDGHQLYERKNLTHKKNNADFVSFESLPKFKMSKVGILQAVLNEFNRNVAPYLYEALTLREFPLIQYKQPRLRQKLAIWQDLSHQTINVYGDFQEPLTNRLAGEIVEVLQKSTIIKQCQIQVTLGKQVQSGLNIQVVRDARDNGAIDETYEVGRSGEVIQHVTIENFGGLDDKNGVLHWSIKDGVDAASDSKLIKLAQELVIKKDINDYQIRPVSSQLLQQTRKYQFYSFEWLSDKEPIVNVTKLWVEAAGTMQFKSKKVDLNQLTEDDELVEVCRWALATLKFKFKSIWENVDCVIGYQDELLMLQKTAKRTIVDLDEVAIKMNASDLDKKIDRDSLIEYLRNLKFRYRQHQNFQEIIEAMVAIFAELPFTMTIKDARVALKKQLSFRNKILRQICNDIEQDLGFTFNNSVRQKENRAFVRGLLGIGLINIDGDYHYFVGVDKSLNSSVSRANLLRKITDLTGDGGSVPALFQDLLGMMSVEFVRNSQYTVLPYPVKYLREYQERKRRLMVAAENNT